jgi:UDP-N-acetylmuramoyl-L-alanyl-D-glutamate--2,6-diaminopimelate ligase
MKIKQMVRKLLPTQLLKQIRPIYHGLKGIFWATAYGWPAKKLITIGITGTKGKTTTSVFAGRLLHLSNTPAGYITTSVISTGDEEFLNPHKMTTIDPRNMQKYLSQMVKNNCKYAVLEMSSQGLEQHRHWGLGGFDTVVFLNIYPEHIEAHGSFEKYKQAKSILFKKLRNNGTALLNSDFKESAYMQDQISSSTHANVVTFSCENDLVIPQSTDLHKQFKLDSTTYTTQLIADFDVKNAYVAAYAIATTSNKDLGSVLKLTNNLSTVPGRMEWVVKDGVIVGENNIKTSSSVSVLVDYAHEPASMEYLLKTVNSWKPKHFDHIIHIVSCDGVGRDDWKKPILGNLSNQYADYSIFTTDNYEVGDKPEEIIATLTKDISGNIESYSNRKDAFVAALNKTIKLKGNTLIVSTGVGSEQGLTQPTGILKWDERAVWREVFSRFMKKIR